MWSFFFALCIGAVTGFFVPTEAVLGASAELIAFITLIMAGLLPAMILTATAIKGDAFSTARVREYGDGLRRQLRFWAVLFAISLVAVLAICLAKILDDKGPITMVADASHIPWVSLPIRASLIVGLSALSVVLARLYPAYLGLRSLLDLTIRMAEVQALANDRSFSDALDAKAARVAAASKPVEKSDWPVSQL